MQSETSRLHSEIVHCLLLDICDFSKQSIEQQQRLILELNEIVHATPEFQLATQNGELLYLDRGDGGALVFTRDPTAPVQCALEIARALRAHPRLQLRMGIHSGPVAREKDLWGRENVYGSGINMAQRVLECGDAGHILLSSRNADDLSQFEEWAPYLHPLGEVEVKHGVRLRLYSLVNGEAGNPAPLTRYVVVRAAAPVVPPAPEAERAAPPEAAAGGWESVGGAVPLDSPFYIARSVDAEFAGAIQRRDSTILIKGARQMGKTSLLARGLQQARESGTCVVCTDLQALNARHFESADSFLLGLAAQIARLLRLPAPRDSWDADLGASMNMNWFLESQALGSLSQPLVWALDEVDRLSSCAFGREIFSLFRSWHNRRALDPSGPWSRLTLAIAYATEAHLFITDMNQSPFNVGTRLTLEDFTPEQVAELNRKYGATLPDGKAIERFYALVGGQPYLARHGLSEMTARRLDIGAFEAQADRDEGLYSDHLRRMLASISGTPRLLAGVRALLHGDGTLDSDSFYALRSSGVIVGHTVQEARLRCRLYADYLHRHIPA